MKKCFLLLIVSLTFNACNSVPSDKEIQISIYKNVVFESISDFGSIIRGTNDSIKSVFIGKKKLSNKEYKVYYSHGDNVYENIKLISLDNGKWIMERDDQRWEIK